MRYILPISFLSILLLSTSCGNKSEHDNHTHDHGDTTTTGNATDALYDEVMKVHDEVMPKMEDIYKLQQELKKQIADSPNLVDEKRQELEEKIATLEEASKGMMIWMREFNPPDDSLGEETMRTYLESEMEKVKKVKESINEVLKSDSDSEQSTIVKIEAEKIAGKTEEEVSEMFGKGSMIETVNPSKTNCPCPKIKYLDGKIEIVFINKRADWITLNTNPQEIIIGDKSNYESVNQFPDYTYLKVFTK